MYKKNTITQTRFYSQFSYNFVILNTKWKLKKFPIKNEKLRNQNHFYSYFSGFCED